MSQFCTAHLERTGQKRPIYQLDLCRDCFDGKPIVARIECYGTQGPRSFAELDEIYNGPPHRMYLQRRISE